MHCSGMLVLNFWLCSSRRVQPRQPRKHLPVAANTSTANYDHESVLTIIHTTLIGKALLPRFCFLDLLHPFNDLTRAIEYTPSVFTASKALA